MVANALLDVVEGTSEGLSSDLEAQYLFQLEEFHVKHGQSKVAFEGIRYRV
jgi:hypothetical protein